MKRPLPVYDLSLNVDETGPVDGPTLVLAHGLGMNLHIWDDVLSQLPVTLRVIRYDLRGHGATSGPAASGSMGALVRDAEGLLDALQVKDCVFVGLGLGGMIAQGLAVKRLDLVRALVLTGTAAKWGLRAIWEARAASVLEDGMHAVAEEDFTQWFTRANLQSSMADTWRTRLERMDPKGYADGCMAMAGADFYTPTSGLRLPVLGLAGVEDRTTPPDLQRETVELVPGSRFQLLRKAGHLAPVEQPQAFAEALCDFLTDIGHVLPA